MCANPLSRLKSSALQASAALKASLQGGGAEGIANGSQASPSWLRSSYFNARNKELVEAARRGDYPYLIRHLVAQDSEHPGLFPDELVEARVGLALILREIEESAVHLHVVDVAAGNCQLLRRLADQGHRTTGVDASPLRVLQNRAWVPNLLFGIAEELPLGDACADVVIATEILEHVFDPVKTVREIWRVLKENGKVYCQVPYLDFADGVNHLRHFDSATLQELFLANGFANPVVRRIPYLVSEEPNNLFLTAEKMC